MVEIAEVLWGDSTLTLFGRVGITESLEESMDGRIEDVGVVFEVERAWPVKTPEFRNQVANGRADTPSQNFFWRRIGKVVVSSSWSGETAFAEGLEKSACDGSFGRLGMLKEVVIVGDAVRR